MASPSLETSTAPYSLEQAFDDVSAIRSCRAHVGVERITRRLVRFVGGEQYVFLSWEPAEGDGNERFRFLIGCSPVWCQEYNDRKWCVIDPCLRYAKTNSDPLFPRTLPLETEGQRELMAAAARYGFRSGMIVPAHGPRGARVGLLYLGSEALADSVEPHMWRYRGLMTTLSLTLLTWHVEVDRLEALEGGPFDKTDLALLSYVARDFDTPTSAELLGIDAGEIDRRFRAINRRLKVTSRKSAAQRALALGLIAP